MYIRKRLKFEGTQRQQMLEEQNLLEGERQEREQQRHQNEIEEIKQRHLQRISQTADDGHKIAEEAEELEKKRNELKVRQMRQPEPSLSPPPQATDWVRSEEMKFYGQATIRRANFFTFLKENQLQHQAVAPIRDRLSDRLARMKADKKQEEERKREEERKEEERLARHWPALLTPQERAERERIKREEREKEPREKREKESFAQIAAIQRERANVESVEQVLQLQENFKKIALRGAWGNEESKEIKGSPWTWRSGGGGGDRNSKEETPKTSVYAPKSRLVGNTDFQWRRSGDNDENKDRFSRSRRFDRDRRNDQGYGD